MSDNTFDDELYPFKCKKCGQVSCVCDIEDDIRMVNKECKEYYKGNGNMKHSMVLSYIANSPSKENGGFDSITIEAAKWAISEILRLRRKIKKLKKIKENDK